MKVSIIQMDVIYKSPLENQEKVMVMMEKAMTDQPDVIILPEMWNTGYALNELSDIADFQGQETIALMSDFAKKHDVNVIAGSVAVERDGRFYNTAYSFNRKGHLVNHYDKVHLFGLMAEDKYISAGEQESLFEIDHVRVSQLICYDIRFPEWVRRQMSQGAEILFVSAQWPDSRIDQWEILLRARAVENQAFVVAVNRVGKGPNDHFNGRSMVINPMGDLLFKDEKGTELVKTVTLDLEQVNQVRGIIPVFADRRPDLYK